MSVARYWRDHVDLLVRHPNELDLRRIERAIEARKRYRYVHPRVLPHEDGYLVRCACCSRNIDPDGGEVDVAWLRWQERLAGWALMRKDHGAGEWVMDGYFQRLAELFERLNADPDRLFWQ